MGLRDTTRSPRYNRADRSGKLLLSCGMLGRPPGMWASSVFATDYLSLCLPPARFIFLFQPSFMYHRDSSFFLHRSSRPFPFLSPFSPPLLIHSLLACAPVTGDTRPNPTRAKQPTLSFQSVIHSTPLPYLPFPRCWSNLTPGPRVDAHARIRFVVFENWIKYLVQTASVGNNSIGRVAESACSGDIRGWGGVIERRKYLERLYHWFYWDKM